MISFRPAEDRDLDAILAIHNDAILHSTAAWLDEPVDRAEREGWLAAHRERGHPVIVAEVDGATAGYASYGPWRTRPGYRYTVENSVYLSAQYQGRGLGRQLMVELIAIAKGSGMHMMIAGIEAGNAVSVGLHESLGFERAGIVREVGTKFDRWLDLAILQLKLND